MNENKNIALSMIIKDSEPPHYLQRCLNSAAPYVDGIFLTITHTTKTPSKTAKDLGRELKVYCLSRGYPEPEITYFKWIKNFAAARNYAMEQIPQEDYPWFIWLDADDVLAKGENLREVQRRAIEVNAGAVFFNYIYRADFNKDGTIRNILIEHLRERLIRNDGSYKWIGAIHETLIEQRGTNKTDSNLCGVIHMTTDDRGMDAIHRNIEILENELETAERKDPRIVYYLGKAYFDLHTTESEAKAEDLITKYLEGAEDITPSGWEEERAQAWAYLAEIHRNRRHFNKAIKATANAMIESPKFPNFYIDMALNYVYAKRFDKALFWVQLAQQVPYPKTTLVLNPRDMQARTLEILFNIGANTGNIDQAWAASMKLSEIFPDNESIEERVKALSETKIDNEAAHKILAVANYLKDNNQEDKIPHLIDALPDNFREEPVFLSLQKDFMPVKEWEDDEIAIFCGRGFEKWSPDSLSKGIGGSEEAVIHVSRQLSNLGWRVTVYADPETRTKDEGYNVEYRPYYEFNERDSFNVLIGWRNIAFYDRDWNAKKKYLWLHDVANPMEYREDRVRRIDKIFVLSEAHKRTVINDWNKGWLPDDKFLLTGNGINLEDFDLELENDPHTLIWTSSYDRGIEHLLKMWPDVLKEVPDAKLEIFYGWNLFESFYKNNPERMAWKAKVDGLMKQKGITHHGRVGQDKILEWTAKAGIWAYPTHFYEISCITAMKCQALGAIPVVCDYAALEETVQHGVKIDVSEDDIYDPDIAEQFKNELISLLKDEGRQAKIRPEMIEWARSKFGWDKVAKNWSDEFKR